MAERSVCPECLVETTWPHECDPEHLAESQAWMQGLMEANERNPAVLAMRRSFARRRRLKKILTLGRSR